ncbi:MAG: hypothetical protein VW455_12355 [Nitrospinota bacterium]
MTQRISLLSVLVALIFYANPVFGDNFSSEVAIANDLYSKNKFQQAADSYESLIERGFHNGYLYYNLGNAYIRLGKKGHAILNYIRAKKLIPREENLQANLNFAIQQTRDKTPAPTPDTLSTFFFWINDLSINENLKMALVLNLIFWSILLAWFYFRSDFLKLARNFFLVILFISLLGNGIQLYLTSISSTGVVLAKEVEVKSGFGQSNVTLFELHEGALVTVSGQSQGWLEIQINSKQKGWVPKESIGI